MNLLKVSAIFGAAGVILGALGAHALKPQLLELDTMDSWCTATLYHLVHAAALLALALSGLDQSSKAARAAAWLWTSGILLFSGSLYLLATMRWLWLGPITPLGGLALIGGWILIGFAKPGNPKSI